MASLASQSNPFLPNSEMGLRKSENVEALWLSERASELDMSVLEAWMERSERVFL